MGDSPASYDPRLPGFFADPYPHYATLRAENPIHRTRFGFIIVTRYHDLVTGYSHPRLSRNTRLWDGFDTWRRGSTDGPLEQMMQNWLVMIDPPRHTPLRAIHEQVFGRELAASAGPAIEKIVGELLGSARAAGGLDVVAELADPMPVYVINSLLDLPRGDWDQLVGWSHAIAATTEPLLMRSVLAEGVAALEGMHEYFGTLVAQRRRDPGLDLLSALANAEVDGVRLGEPELLDSLVFLYQAGHPTTTQLLALAVHSLLRNPDELARLGADRSLLPGAVEELQRYDGPVQMNDRVATEDMQFQGFEVRAGELVRLCIGSANRDPEQYPDPDRLDIARQVPDQLGFGHGLHYCVGAQLGRLQARAALGGLLDLAPAIRLTGEELRFLPSVSNRGLAELPVEL